ncbi:response regulator transcription factor [Butyricimonas virosa]|uniref:response regulator transcription factor n=1 Tax=Butyricimonas virosa TaxID=544645 RepID=UPI00242E48A8|nr:response regulator transcription factor [Butyricimonas virosa]
MDTTIRILYAEDDADGAKLTKMILEKENFDVEIALNGAKAWDAYKKQKPDILLVDLDMPKIDGLELTRMIRENDRQTHIIVYTSHGEPSKEIAVLDAGADEFIPKDSPEVLIAHMKRLRDRIKGCMNIPHLYQLSKHTTYNSITREVTIDGITKRLPKNEGRFLQLLCAKNHEIADKSYLIIGTWGKADKNKEPEVKKYISRLRGYLKADPSLQIDHEGDGYILICLAD